MAWFRRSRSAPPVEPEETLAVDGEPAVEDSDSGEPASHVRMLPVPVATAPALARTERALQMLATQSAQLHTCIVQLEHRVDALSAALIDQMERPSYDDLLAARLHSAKVAAELARLEVNIAARLEAVRTDIADLRHGGSEIDLRDLTPADSGWPLRTG